MRNALLLLIFLGLLHLTCGILGAAPPPEADVIRVATYNVRNYLSMDRLVEGRFRRDYPKPESEKRVVRESIRAVSPDVLILQEIGGEAYLRELQVDLRREGLDLGKSALVEGVDDVRHVAALWRDGLSMGVERHEDLEVKLFGESSGVRRGMLELQLKDAAGAVVNRFFALHLKSKYTSDQRDYQSRQRRTLEAQEARDRILDLCPDPNIQMFMIVGDLNDTPESRPLARLLQRGEVEISRVLPARDELGMEWTHYYRKGATYSTVDYFLLSPAWGDPKALRCGVLGRDDYYAGSDHRLVWVDLPRSQLGLGDDGTTFARARFESRP